MTLSNRDGARERALDLCLVSFDSQGHLAGDDASHSFHISRMLLFEDPGGERFGGVVTFYLDPTLQNDRPRIEIFVYKMHRTA